MITVADEADVPPTASAVWQVEAGDVTPGLTVPHAKGFRKRSGDPSSEPVELGDVIDT